MSLKTFAVVVPGGYASRYTTATQPLSATEAQEAYKDKIEDIEAYHFDVRDGALLFYGESFVEGPIQAFASGCWLRVYE